MIQVRPVVASRVAPSFVQLVHSHKIFSDSYTHAIPEISLGVIVCWSTLQMLLWISALRGGLPECSQVLTSRQVFKCASKAVKSLLNSHFLVSEQKNHMKSGCLGMQNGWSGWGAGLSGGSWVSFLMSRGHPRWSLRGCRGALCWGSEMQRWMGRRCTWEPSGCLPSFESLLSVFFHHSFSSGAFSVASSPDQGLAS